MLEVVTERFHHFRNLNQHRMGWRKIPKVTSTRMHTLRNIRRSYENMASENYLEEALNAKVDETAVNAIMKTLEIQLSSASSVSTQQDSSIAFLGDTVVNESDVDSHTQNYNVTNTFCTIDNTMEFHSQSQDSRVCSISAQKTTNIDDQEGLNAAMPSTQFDLHVEPLNQIKSKMDLSDESSPKSQENMKPAFLSGAKTSNSRPVFQHTSFPSNFGYSVFPPQTLLQTSFSDKDSNNIVSHTPSPVVANTTNLPASENKNESKTIMIKCSSESPVLMNIVTVPVTAHNSVNVSDTLTATMNSSCRTVGRVAAPKPMGPTTTAQQVDTNVSNTIMPNNVQLVNVIPLKPGNSNKDAPKNVVPRMVIGAPPILGNRTTPQVKMAVQSQGQDGKPSQGHLLLKNQNGQYQWVRVNLATSRTAPGIPSVTPSATRQNVVAHSKTNPSEMSVGVQIPSLADKNSKVPLRPGDLVTKEKCQTFLVKILELASNKPENIKQKIYNLMQDLIDGKVDVEYFTHFLELFLHLKSQFSFTEFLKKSLPLIRHSLATKELVLEGVRPPPFYVCLSAGSPIAMVPHLSSSAPISSSSVTQSTQPSILNQSATENNSNFKSRDLYWQSSVPLSGKLPTSNTSCKAAGITQVSILEHPNISKNIGVSNPSCFGQSLIRPRVAPIKPASSLILQVPTSVNTTDFCKDHIPTPPPSLNHTFIDTTKVHQIVESNIQESFDHSQLKNSSDTYITKSIMGPSVQSSTKQVVIQPKGRFYSCIDFATDEINNVASIHGVNLEEESPKILNSGKCIGTKNRSCKDETFLNIGALHNKINQIASTHGLQEVPLQTATLLSQACEEYIKSILEKLSVTAAHRATKLQLNLQHEVVSDVKGQLKFLEEVDQARKRNQDENSMKYDNMKFKGKHKKVLRADVMELRQQEANQTALQAIGFRKKAKYGSQFLINNVGLMGNRNLCSSGSSEGCFIGSAWPQIKRVKMQDLIFVLEQEKRTCRSVILYRAHFKR